MDSILLTFLNFLSILLIVVFFVFLHDKFRIKKLQKEYDLKLSEFDKISKMLVRRDFELNQSLDTLRSMDEAKSQFVNIAAHQLRTPISAIKWILKMLLDEDLGKISSGQREYIQECYTTNERLIKLVNDLLNVSRMESGRLIYTFKETEILSLIANIVNEFVPKAEEKGVVLKFNTDTSGDLKITVDIDKIKMVIENLIENAVNYTISGKIEVSLQNQQDHVIISVADTGIGISPTDKEHIFSKFNRSEEALKLFPDGSGLGLFLSQKIAVSHGGVIEVESELGKGSIFKFILPKSGFSATPYDQEKKLIKNP